MNNAFREREEWNSLRDWTLDYGHWPYCPQDIRHCLLDYSVNPGPLLWDSKLSDRKNSSFHLWKVYWWWLGGGGLFDYSVNPGPFLWAWMLRWTWDWTWSLTIRKLIMNWIEKEKGHGQNLLNSELMHKTHFAFTIDVHWVCLKKMELVKLNSLNFMFCVTYWCRKLVFDWITPFMKKNTSFMWYLTFDLTRFVILPFLCYHSDKTVFGDKREG